MLILISILLSGYYHPSEEFTVKLHPKLFQAVFEVRGATFVQGKCLAKNRIAGQSAAIIFPTNNLKNVSIHSVWSKGYSSGVKTAFPFILHPMTVAGSSDEF
jgi:hypothetical protein